MAEVFNDGFESGDVSGWTSETDAGSDGTVTEAAALNGTAFGYGCDYTLTSFFVNKTGLSLGSSGTARSVRARFRFKVGSFSQANSDFLNILNIREGSNYRMGIAVTTVAGVLKVVGRVRNDAGAVIDTTGGDISTGEHYIEALFQSATSSSNNDGICTIFVDGVEVGTTTTIDLWSQTAANVIELGCGPTVVGVTTTGTYDVDEMILRNDGVEIGSGIVSSGGSSATTATALMQLGVIE